MADRILDRHPLPESTSTAIEMPRKIVRSGVRKDRAYEGRQAWLDWMKKLKVGESFMVDNYTVQYVQRIARMLDYDLVTSYASRSGLTRIWIYGKPGKRHPILQRITIVRQKKVVREKVLYPKTLQGTSAGAGGRATNRGGAKC